MLIIKDSLMYFGIKSKNIRKQTLQSKELHLENRKESQEQMISTHSSTNLVSDGEYI